VVSGGFVVRDAILVLAAAPLAYYIVTLVAAASFTRNASPPSSVDLVPPISVLKPIRGLDRETYENYASFCNQDYPDFEILFCVADHEDTAIPVIQKIIADFPGVPVRMLVGSEPLGVSDKVNKLCRLVREARHETVLICDSDVRVGSNFLRTIVQSFRKPGVGGVTCLYKGLTDGSIASDLEALGNSTDFAPGVLVAWLIGEVDFMLGAVMATTKQQIAAIGGFEALVNYLSDDYELGNRIVKTGGRVELSRFPVSIVYPRQSFGQALRHQLRWNMTVRCSRPWGHLGLLFTQGLPWAVLAAAVAPRWWIGAAYLAGYGLLRFCVAWLVGGSAIGDPIARNRVWLAPVRDAVAFFIWLWSFFPQRIHWRGQDFYIRDKQLVPVSSR
jgi:ceramide glucosyltransferase